MARPKKLGTVAMLKIVNDYYESCGDPGQLKYSLLEAYATSMGFDVKAYDFRRDHGVRSRMDELRDLSLLVTEGGAIAYKNLDVDALIGRSRNIDALKSELLELDAAWRRIYDRALDISKKNDALSRDSRKMAEICEQLEHDLGERSMQVSQLKAENRAFSQTNAYLRKTIRTYLYPAIANEILKSENVLDQADTEVMPETMAALADADLPTPFSKTVTEDMAFASREESLLWRMKAQTQGGGDA